MKIYLDPYRLMPPLNAFEVKDDATFVEARRQMLNYERRKLKQDINIVVYERPYLEWFRDVEDWVVRISPRDKLLNRYPGIELAYNLTDADIIDLGLLDNNVEPTERALMKHFFDGLFDESIQDASFIYRLCQMVVDQRNLFNNRYLRRQWEAKLVLLPKPFAPIYNLDVEYCKILIEGIYIAGIPALMDEWQHENTFYLKSNYGIQISELRPHISWITRRFKDHPTFEQKIQTFLSEALKQGEITIDTLPAYYRAEVQALLSVDIKLTAEQIHVLEDRYNHLLTHDLKRRLRMLVSPILQSPPVVKHLSLTEQIDSWQQWAINSFIPYKFWLDNSSKKTEIELNQIDNYSTQYSDWLFDNYPTIIARNSTSTNFNVRQDVGQLLQENDNRIIWLIIDGFPAAFLHLLEQNLRDYNLNNIKTHWNIAALPTITEIGIPTLLNGLAPNSSAFTTDRKEALRRAFPNKVIIFETANNQFNKALHSDYDLCCLHWGDIDKLLHKGDHDFDSPIARINEINNQLKNRISQIAEAIHYSVDRKTTLIISTDHGATKCLRNKSGISNSRIREAASEIPHERCIKLESKLKNENLDPEETYYLTCDLSHNNDEWIIARGYRYFGSNDHGYRHGGLTPEETIVPLLIVNARDIEIIPLRVYYFGKKDLEQGKTQKEFAIQIRNENAFPIEVHKLAISEDLNCLFTLPISIDKNSVKTLTAPIKIAQKYRAQNGQLSLTATITFIAQGEFSTERYIFSVPIKTSELDEFNFDNF